MFCAAEACRAPSKRWNPHRSAGTGELSAKPTLTGHGAELSARLPCANDHQYVDSALLMTNRSKRIIR